MGGKFVGGVMMGSPGVVVCPGSVGGVRIGSPVVTGGVGGASVVVEVI